MSQMDDSFAFFYYLKSKYPDDYLKFTDDKTPEDVKNSIINKHAHEFEIWKEIPYDVLLHWNGNPPIEIMEAASKGNYRKLQLDPYFIREDDDTYTTNFEDFHPAPEAVVASIAYSVALDNGYSQDASYGMAEQSMLREVLREKALDNTLTIGEREIWRKSREKTRDIIRKDWAEHTPERLLVHVFAQYDRGKISVSELTDTTRELMGRIDSNGRHDELLKHLSSPWVQRRLSMFSDEVLDALSQTILSNIKLTKEQSEAIQSHIAGRSLSRAKREMLTYTPDNLSSRQRMQNIPSALVNAERVI